jgi:sugar phosphate permease
MTKIEAKYIPTWQAWMALFMGGLFYCFQFLVRVSPNVMTEELMLSFMVDAAGLSFIIAWSNAGYSMMQIPLGVMMDKLGPRRIIAAGAILCAVSTYFFSTATTPYLAGVARFMIGLGSACGYLGTLKLGSQWFARDKMPMVVGITMTLGIAGASLGGLPLEYLVESVGWQSSLHIVALAGIIIGAAVLLVIGKNPPYHAHVPKDQHILVDLFAIFKKPQAWIFAIFGMLMYLPLDLMGNLWGISFLQQKYHLAESEATIPILFMFIGVAVGSFFFAWLTDAWKSRKKPMMLGALLTTSVYLIIIFGPSLSIQLVCALFFLGGFFFNGQVLSFTCICEIMPLHASGVAVGFVNSIVMLGGFIFMPMVGEILVVYWDGGLHNGAPIYSASDYQWALAIIPICLGLSLLLTKGIRETFHLHQPLKK